MAKIIKKKFKSSLPFFLVLSILSLSVFGLVFNFNIEINKIGDKIGLSLIQPEVEAQIKDTATTTVTVKNAAPAFVGDAAESPASASTSPVNVGDLIGFTGTASDAEGDNFYLVICDQDGVTPGAGGSAPSCTNTQFCVSGVTAPNTQASCSYSLGAIVPETQNWVAYVCDDNSIDSDCVATSNSGTGDSGSPFYINHAPSITGVATTIDNQDPGADFTFTATSTDADITGGADVLELSICATNSWATSTGCAVPMCTGTSTSPNVACTWTSGVPLNDISYNYYAFVKDWHQMPASGNSQTSTYTVNNVAPSVTSILLNNGSDIVLNIKGAANIDVYASSTVVTDNNGCADITSATSTVYLSSATNGANCSADDNDCYQIPASSCTISGCSGGSDISVNVECSTSLVYYAIPTDDASSADLNPYASDNWLASIRAFDEALSYASSTATGVEVGVSTGIEVAEVLIDYGTLVAGTDTGANNATTTIINAGNSPLDTDLIGDDMLRNGTGPDYIAANNQEFSLTTFTYGAGTNIASSSQSLADIFAPRPSTSSNVEDNLYWGINVPVIVSGDYSGLNTFTALLDKNVAVEW